MCGLVPDGKLSAPLVIVSNSRGMFSALLTFENSIHPSFSSRDYNYYLSKAINFRFVSTHMNEE